MSGFGNSSRYPPCLRSSPRGLAFPGNGYQWRMLNGNSSTDNPCWMSNDSNWTASFDAGPLGMMGNTPLIPNRATTAYDVQSLQICHQFQQQSIPINPFVEGNCTQIDTNNGFVHPMFSFAPTAPSNVVLNSQNYMGNERSLGRAFEYVPANCSLFPRSHAVPMRHLSCGREDKAVQFPEIDRDVSVELNIEELHNFLKHYRAVEKRCRTAPVSTATSSAFELPLKELRREDVDSIGLATCGNDLVQSNSGQNFQITFEQTQREELITSAGVVSIDHLAAASSENNDLNNNRQTVSHVVSNHEDGATEVDTISGAGKTETTCKGHDSNSQLPLVSHENAKAKSCGGNRLCGVDDCSRLYTNPEYLCRHLQYDHCLPIYIRTLSFEKKEDCVDFFNQLSNDQCTFQRIGHTEKRTVFRCNRVLSDKNTTSVRLVDVKRGGLSSSFKPGCNNSLDLLQASCGPFVRQGGTCPAFIAIHKLEKKYKVKVCDWHLHGPVVPKRALEMMGTMLLLKNLSPPVIKMVMQGRTSEFCTPRSAVDLQFRSLNLEQFEGLCRFVRERYADNVYTLRHKMGYIELTDFERRCIVAYESSTASRISQGDETSGSVLEVHPGHG